MQRTYAVTATPHTSSTTGQAESDARASRSPSQQALSQNQASGAIEVSSTRVQKESGSSGPEIPSKPAVRVLHVVDNLKLAGPRLKWSRLLYVSTRTPTTLLWPRYARTAR